MSAKLVLKSLSLTVTFNYRERHVLKTINTKSLFQCLSDEMVAAWMGGWRGEVSLNPLRPPRGSDFLNSCGS